MNKKIIICKWIFFTLMILVNGFIIYQACLQGSSSEEWSNPLVQIVVDLSGGSITPSTVVFFDLSLAAFLRKLIGHFSFFGLNGVVTFLYFYFLNKDKLFKHQLITIVIPIAIGIFVAFLTELIQLLIPGRSGEIVDVIIDISGYLLGFSLTLLITYLIDRKRKLLKNSN